MLSACLALGRLQEKVDENKRKKKHSRAEQASGLPSLVPGFVVRDSQRVTVLRHCGDTPDIAALFTGSVYL